MSLPAIRRPRRLRTGDVVGVVAPAGAVDDERLQAGVRVLEGWGFRVEVGLRVREREAYLAGDDESRREDLQRMMDRDAVRAIFCARGGYGSQRLLPHLDWLAMRADPKAIVGYSDVTALLNVAVGSGLMAVHGPMVGKEIATGLAQRSESHLRSVLGDPDYLWRVEAPIPIRPGRARGRLVGGGLSMLGATSGTPYALDPAGGILFLEDVGERPYRLDRLLIQLRQSGIFERACGVVFGTLAGCPTVAGVGPLDVVRACCGDLGCPVAFGVLAGHDAGTGDGGTENLALPFGVSVELDADAGTLSALEPAVC